MGRNPLVAPLLSIELNQFSKYTYFMYLGSITKKELIEQEEALRYQLYMAELKLSKLAEKSVDKYDELLDMDHLGDARVMRIQADVARDVLNRAYGTPAQKIVFEDKKQTMIDVTQLPKEQAQALESAALSFFGGNMITDIEGQKNG